MRVFMTIGTLVGVVAGLVIIKQLDLPFFVTIPLVAALIIGMIVLLAKQMAAPEKKAVSTMEQKPSGEG